jgi:hypothetical protein
MPPFEGPQFEKSGSEGFFRTQVTNGAKSCHDEREREEVLPTSHQEPKTMAPTRRLSEKKRKSCNVNRRLITFDQ